MRIGIVLPSYLYNDTRRGLAKAAFESLAKTTPPASTPELLLLYKEGTLAEYSPYLEPLQKVFTVTAKSDLGLSGTEQTLAWGTTWLVDKKNVDSVTWMGDDALFNHNWLRELEGLMTRHPQAKAWSVYRSAFEFIHRTLQEEGDDVRVRSICGHGMTFTAKEWCDWGIKWGDAIAFGEKGLLTMDLMHSEQRSGERWVTRRSYVEHTGKDGVHCSPALPEYARDFVGV